MYSVFGVRTPVLDAESALFCLITNKSIPYQSWFTVLIYLACHWQTFHHQKVVEVLQFILSLLFVSLYKTSVQKTSCELVPALLWVTSWDDIPWELEWAFFPGWSMKIHNSSVASALAYLSAPSLMRLLTPPNLRPSFLDYPHPLGVQRLGWHVRSVAHIPVSQASYMYSFTSVPACLSISLPQT